MLQPLRLCVADLWVKSTCRERGHVKEACTDLRESSAHPPVPGSARGSSTCSPEVKYANRDGLAKGAYHMVVASAPPESARQGAYALAMGGIRDREEIPGPRSLRGAVRFDIPLSRDDSRLGQTLHGAASSGMSPVLCEGAREANSVQNDESAEPSHRAPQAAKRRLWAEQSIPAFRFCSTYLPPPHN